MKKDRPGRRFGSLPLAAKLALVSSAAAVALVPLAATAAFLPRAEVAHESPSARVDAVIARSSSASAVPRAPVDWQGDLAYLTAVLPRVHANAYHSVSRERFAAAARELRERIGDLPGPVARVELAGLVAMIGDGHTRVSLLRPGADGVPAQPDSGFVAVPIRLRWFSDGLYVRSAAREHRELVGARLVKVGSSAAEEAAGRVRSYMHRDNEMTLRLGVPWLLVRPAFLHAAGVIDEFASIPMEFVTREGDRVRRVLRPSIEADPTEVDALAMKGARRPLWLRDIDRPYWFEASEDGTVYVQFNAVVDGEHESLAAFAARLGDALETNRARRVIVDLRHNDGGNFVLALPLVDVLDRFDEDRGPGSLFVLIGRATFSAAGVFAALVEARTDAVFVGEPTGARPNTYGDLDTFVLPSSGLVVTYSERYFQPAGPYDERPWIDPDVSVEPSFEEYAAGGDPVLAAAEAYRPVEPLAERLVAAAREGSVEDALALYGEFTARPERRYYWAADDLVRLGFHYWRANELEASIPVWHRLARDHPNSAEGQENLAETYQALGDRESAVEALLASIRIDPRNPDAVELAGELCGREGVWALLRMEPGEEHNPVRLRRACEIGEDP